MSVCCDCGVLSGTGLCDKPITRPEESYRPWGVIVCDLQTHEEVLVHWGVVALKDKRTSLWIKSPIISVWFWQFFVENKNISAPIIRALRF